MALNSKLVNKPGSKAQLPVWLRLQGESLLVEVLVSPRASRTRVLGIHDQRLKVQLAAPPVDGQANDALVRFLAESLEIARAQVEIVSGATGRRKTVRVMGVDPIRVVLRLSPNSKT